MNELVVLLERTRDLFPVDELGDLLRQLPKFLKVDVGTWQSANGKEINENSSIFHLTYSLYSLIGTSLVEEVQVLDEQREEWNNDSFTFVGRAGRSPHCRLQRRPITAEVTRRVHLMFENREFCRLNLRPLL